LFLMWSTKPHFNSSRSWECGYASLLETDSSLDRQVAHTAQDKTFSDGKTKIGYVIAQLRKFEDLSLRDFSRCCASRL